MTREEPRSPAAPAPAPPARNGCPYWRAVLEARWEARLQELTELSLAYHGAAGPAPEGNGDGAGHQQAQALLRRAVAARRKLANVEDALARLAAGGFGHCEQCGSQISGGLLALIPETRYCLRCDPEADRARAAAGRSPR